MKKHLFALLIGLSLVAVSLPAMVSAQEESYERYSGFFLAEERANSMYYWYVHPETGERYAINSSDEFSRLLRNVSVPVTAAELQDISETPGELTNTAIAYRGMIVLEENAINRAWYVDPITFARYFLYNGNEGFETAQSLSIDIIPERLIAIPITRELGFSEMRYTFGRNSDETYDPDVYDQVFDLLRYNHLYRDDFTESDLYYGSIKGLVNATGDPYSEFLTPQENQDQNTDFFGEVSIEGIGAVIQARDNSIYIVRTLEGAPAETAGLQSLDQILAVDGQSTAGYTVAEAVSKIKGPSGTYVTLQVYRASTGVTFDLEVQRAKVVVPSVQGETLEDGKIAYFQFTLFTADLADEFLVELSENIGPETQGIIVDLRDNIGGITQSAARLADYWLSDGERVYSTRYRDEQYDFIANPDRYISENMPTMILVNGGTASAAEIYTSALQENGEATVIGTQTYGKGTGQNLEQFADGSGLKFTTFEWLTSDGSSISGVGVTPDIVLEQGTKNDVQLERARQIILGY